MRCPCVLNESKILTPPARPHSVNNRFCELLHLRGVLTFFLYLRSKLVTEVVLQRTSRQNNKIRYHNVHLHHSGPFSLRFFKDGSPKGFHPNGVHFTIMYD